jgi:hypothetical protein
LPEVFAVLLFLARLGDDADLLDAGVDRLLADDLDDRRASLSRSTSGTSPSAPQWMPGIAASRPTAVIIARAPLPLSSPGLNRRMVTPGAAAGKWGAPSVDPRPPTGAHMQTWPSNQPFDKVDWFG